MYLLNDSKYILQDKLIGYLMNDGNKMDENVEKVLSLTTELLKKKNWNDKKELKMMNNYL